MGRKCSVFGCTTGYKTNPYNGKVYSFPQDTEKRRLWINALPNLIKEENITEWMGVCDLQWPTNFKATKVRWWWIPDEVPSIFDNVPTSSFQQTAAKVFEGC